MGIHYVFYEFPLLVTYAVTPSPITVDSARFLHVSLMKVLNLNVVNIFHIYSVFFVFLKKSLLPRDHNDILLYHILKLYYYTITFKSIIYLELIFVDYQEVFFSM